jgi:hypothetical protein
VAAEETPAVEGEQPACIVLVMPRNVLQIWAPLLAFSAYSYPSQDPKKTTPPTTVAEAATTPPVLNLQSRVSLEALAVESVFSPEFAALRAGSCK